MTFQEWLSIVIGVLYLAVVVAILVNLRRVDLRPPLPLFALLLLFALRAVFRFIQPLDDEPDWLLLVLDLALLVVLLAFLASVRRLVASFVHERDAMQRAQIDYDDALLRHESNVASRHGSALDRLDTAIGTLSTARDDAARGDAERAAREALSDLRGE
jgi:hypothetical protein